MIVETHSPQCAPLNCWEFKKCGREVGGRRAQGERGVCPAMTDTSAQGINRGRNAGRYCWKIPGTWCDEVCQHDLEHKRINCMLCDFYKLVMKEEGSSFKGVDEEFTQDRNKIVYYVYAAFQDDKMLEIILDDRVRIFFSRFMDHRPELIPKLDADGEPLLDEQGNPVTLEPHYVPGSYLHKGDHLLLHPLTPAIGNAQIRSCKKVTVRFFEGVKAFEAQVDFLGMTSVRGEPGIQLSFPEWLSISRKRMHFRVTIPEYVHTPITLEKIGFAPTPARLLDISPGGLSFCHLESDPSSAPSGSSPSRGLPAVMLDDGDALKLTVQPQDLPGVTLKGILRRKVCACERQCRGKNRFMVGVQFDIPDRATENRLLEIVAHFQRIHAQENLSKRIQQERLQKLQQESEGGQATRKLMEEKSKFSLDLTRLASSKIWS